MFILAILAALAVTVSAQGMENCATKSTGVTSTKSQYLLPSIEDGNCNQRVDLSFVNGCHNVGVYISICDVDAKPLVSINNDEQYIDITREGHCRGAITGFVQVFCLEPIARAGSGAGKGRTGGGGRNRVSYN